MASSAAASLDARAGWLVRAWREASPDRSLRMQRGLSERVRDLDPTVSIDGPRLSRWETGNARMNLHLLSRVEQALGRPAHHLVAVLDGLYRDHDRPLADPSPEASPHAWSAAVHDAVTDVLTGRHDGSTWFALSRLLGRPHALVYLPPDRSARLARTLVGEIPRSVGSAYVQRIEAMRRLLPTPVLRADLVRAIGEVVTRPHAQSVVDLVANLYEAGGDPPLDMLLRLARHERPIVRSAALWSLQALARRARLPRHLDEPLATVVAATLRDGDDADVERARTIAERLPPELGRRLAPMFQRRGPPRAESTTSAPDGTRLDGDVERTVRGLDREQDETLRDLLNDALGRRGQDLAQEASLLLMSSPLRHALASHAAARAADETVTAPGWARLLTYLVTARELRPVVALVRHRDARVRSAAFRALAHVPADTDEIVAAWDGGPWDEPGATSPTVPHLYALGMVGHPLLHQVVRDERLPAETRGAAAWWTEHGTAVHDRTH